MKTYTGIELLQAIEDDEFEKNIRFKVTNGTFENFVAYIENKKLKVNMFGREQVLGTDVLIESEFEVIEEMDINIQEIEELDLFDNGQGFNDLRTTIGGYDSNFMNIADKFNELIQAIKQLDRQINNN